MSLTKERNSLVLVKYDERIVNGQLQILNPVFVENIALETRN